MQGIPLRIYCAILRTSTYSLVVHILWYILWCMLCGSTGGILSSIGLVGLVGLVGITYISLMLEEMALSGNRPEHPISLMLEEMA